MRASSLVVGLTGVGVFTAALIYWVTDWMGEMLSRFGKRTQGALPPEEPELADSGKSV